MITLTTEQAQQIEEALEDIVRVFEFETGTPVEALATIRTARAQEQSEQEPVGIVSENVVDGVVEWLGWVPQVGTKLYTAPVRTKDLTDDEIEWLVVDTLETWNSKNTMKDFARAVIAAFKEKNT